MMKVAILSLTITSVMLMTVSCTQPKDERSAESASKSGSMKNIYIALMSYEMEYGAFPDSLSDLVNKGMLTSEELMIRRADGSLSKPEYFPKARGVTSALLAFEPERGMGRMITNVDGSIRMESPSD